MERTRELEGWGATNLLFAGVFGDPVDDARTIATEVLARLRCTSRATAAADPAGARHRAGGVSR